MFSIKSVTAASFGFVEAPIPARGRPVASQSSATASAKPIAADVFDVELALKRCLDSPKLLADMIQCFFADADELIVKMHAALQKGDLQEVGHLGHQLKGTVVYLGAKSAWDAAQVVEQLENARSDAIEADAVVKALGRECEVLKAALAHHQAAVRLCQ